ncbi:hemolysin D [Rhizobium sp. Root1203]|nr:hemolysin D [Rhizobium sp. Root1203]
MSALPSRNVAATEDAVFASMNQSRNQVRKSLVLVAITCSVGLGYVFWRPSSEVLHGAPTRALVELAQVDVSTIKRRDIANEVRVAGSLMPIRRASFTAPVAAPVLELPVKIGDAVKAGALLARFDTAALKSTLITREAAVDAMNARLDLAQSVLARNTNLRERGVASEATRLEAKSQVENLRAQLRSLRAEVADAARALSDAEVRATFDGVVSSRFVEEGQTLAVNTELLTVVDLSRMEVDAGVPTSRISRVQPEQIVELSVEGFPGRKFTGKVVRIAPTAVAGSRAVRVFVTISNDDRLLKGGMFTTGIVKIDDRKAVIALPTVAIRHDQAGPFALKVEGGLLKRQAVELGQAWTDRDLVEVSGLLDGETVVTALLPNLSPDTSVTIGGM